MFIYRARSSRALPSSISIDQATSYRYYLVRWIAFWCCISSRGATSAPFKLQKIINMAVSCKWSTIVWYSIFRPYTMYFIFNCFRIMCEHTCFCIAHIYLPWLKSFDWVYPTNTRSDELYHHICCSHMIQVATKLRTAKLNIIQLFLFGFSIWFNNPGGLWALCLFLFFNRACLLVSLIRLCFALPLTSPRSD